MIYMTGGDNKGGPTRDPTDEEIAMIGIIAVESKAIGCILYQIPNQPISFAEEKPTPRGRTEDALIAWTWKHCGLHCFPSQRPPLTLDRDLFWRVIGVFFGANSYLFPHRSTHTMQSTTIQQKPQQSGLLGSQ